MKSLSLRIASRYLRSRRSSRLVSLITLIATGGVTVGVTALIVVMGVMSGLQNHLREKILIGSPHLRVLTHGEGLILENWEAVRDSVRTFPEVLAVAPFVLTKGLISAGHDYADGAQVLGIEPDTGTMSVTTLPSHFTAGDLTFATRLDSVDGGIILGSGLASRLAAYRGTRVTMISPVGSRFNRATGAFVPRFWTFEVTGEFNTGMYEYDENYVVLPRALAQQFAGLGTAVTGLEVRLTDPWTALDVGERMQETLGYPYRTVDWQSQNSSLFSALKLEKLAMGLILLLIVLVAAFNIVSTLTMVVTDKTREIGILRAMGLSRKVVRRLFVLQGAAIGLVGTFLGTALGILAARLVDGKRLIPLDASVYSIDHLPVQTELSDVMIIVTASVLVAVLATMYPARQAAALAPVDAIRHE